MRYAGGHDGTPDRTLVSWVVSGSEGSTASIVAVSDRAGVATAEVELA